MTGYLFLFRGGAIKLSPEEMQKHMQRWGAWIGELSKQGRFDGGEPLEGTGSVVRGAKKSVTDGPYAEAKDVVGGYLLVKAPDLPSAVELAKGCPIFEAPDGTVEVRAIRPMAM